MCIWSSEGTRKEIPEDQPLTAYKILRWVSLYGDGGWQSPVVSTHWRDNCASGTMLDVRRTSTGIHCFADEKGAVRYGEGRFSDLCFVVELEIWGTVDKYPATKRADAGFVAQNARVVAYRQFVKDSEWQED